MDEEILYRGLKVIEEIYNESMYGVNDIYRIKDIVHALDINHWRSKQWLVDEMSKIYTRLYGDDDHWRDIYVAGGWYGLLPHLLRKRYPSNEVHIISADSDPMAEYYGYKIFPDRDIQYRTENSLQSPTVETARVVVNTSCEHMEHKELADWIRKKHRNSLIVLQSNNYFELPSHINCFTSLEEFTDYVSCSLPRGWIGYKGELDLGDFKRFMVIGR